MEESQFRLLLIATIAAPMIDSANRTVELPDESPDAYKRRKIDKINEAIKDAEVLVKTIKIMTKE